GADPGLTEEAADALVDKAIGDGSAYETFVRWVAEQGGDPRVVAEPARLPGAARLETVVADRAGWVRTVDARAIGEAALRVGAGRLAYGAPIDHGAAVMVTRHVGDPVERGERLAEIRFNGGDAQAAVSLVRAAFDVGEERADPLPTIHHLVAGPNIGT